MTNSDDFISEMPDRMVDAIKNSDGPIYKTPDQMINVNTMKNSDIIVEVYDAKEWMFNQIELKGYRQILNKFKKSFRFNTRLEFTFKNLNKTECFSIFNKLGNIELFIDNKIILKIDDFICFITFNEGKSMINSFSCVIFSPENILVNYIKDKFKKVFKKYTVDENNNVDIYWFYYSIDVNRSRSLHFTENINDIFLAESYPYINASTYIEKFFKSSDPILILMGPPGTGKTRFIRYILKSYLDRGLFTENSSYLSCFYTCDKSIIESGDLFLQFLNSDSTFLIMEDIDYNLKSRESGNTKTMYNLLNISDGIGVNYLRRKKIILSTNLTTKDKIDSALLRPGRCYDVLNFRSLNNKESNHFLKVNNLDITLSNTTYTLAELYRILNRGKEQIKKFDEKKKIGLI